MSYHHNNTPPKSVLRHLEGNTIEQDSEVIKRGDKYTLWREEHCYSILVNDKRGYLAHEAFKADLRECTEESALLIFNALESYNKK